MFQTANKKLIDYGSYLCRCQASVVAITTSIALMLQRPESLVKKSGEYDVEKITGQAFDHAKLLVAECEDKQVRVI